MLEDQYWLEPMSFFHCVFLWVRLDMPTLHTVGCNCVFFIHIVCFTCKCLSLWERSLQLLIFGPWFKEELKKRQEEPVAAASQSDC